MSWGRIRSLFLGRCLNSGLCSFRKRLSGIVRWLIESVASIAREWVIYSQV